MKTDVLQSTLMKCMTLLKYYIQNNVYETYETLNNTLIFKKIFELFSFINTVFLFALINTGIEAQFSTF